MKTPDPQRTEKRILWLSFWGGLILALMELLMAVYSNSQSVLTDGVYDLSELIVIMLTLFLTPLFYKPISEERPYGFLQMESIFTIIKVIMMLSMTLGLMLHNIQLALKGGNPVDSLAVAAFELFQGIVSIIIYIVMRGMGKRIMSPSVKTELMGWRLDIGYSFGVAGAFIFSTLLKDTPLDFITPYFDQIMALVIAACMLPQNIKLLIRAFRDVFLFSPEQEVVDEIKDACGELIEPYGFDPIFYDITRTGRKLWISVYFTVDKDEISLKRFGKASRAIQKQMKQRFNNCFFELIIAPDDELPE